MGRTAVFVDAGYFFAQGSAALAGQHVQREYLELNIPSVVAELSQYAEQQSVGAQLLRIYWYDGVSAHRGPTSEQLRIASTNNVKLRLGFLNSRGQQKGVDSLIVTDLVELGRNQAISDAVLLSGDEDVRIGVQIAQSFGVRVHLLGIAPSRGSQSRQLIQEADTASEWDRNTVSRFLSFRPQMQQSVAAAPHPTAAPSPYLVQQMPEPEERAAEVHAGEQSAAAADSEAVSAGLVAVAIRNANSLTSSQLTSLELYWKAENGVPPELDRILLREGSAFAGTLTLQREQMTVLRRSFTQRVKYRLANPAEVVTSDIHAAQEDSVAAADAASNVTPADDGTRD